MTGAAITTDLLVVGFGKGGKTLAADMGRQGRTVVLVEESALMYGGTCINTGCVPTKSMVYHGEHLPKGVPGATAYAEAVAATEKLTAGLRAANLSALALIPSVTVLIGRARFLDPNSVAVETGDNKVVTVTAGDIRLWMPLAAADRRCSFVLRGDTKIKLLARNVCKNFKFLD